MGAAYGFSPNVTSWGGNPVLINGTYNLFVTEIAYGCFLEAWQHDSTVVHAVASDPAGPYTKVSTILLPEAHNPETLLLPNGSLVMFHIGAGDNSSFSNCSRSRDTAANLTGLPPSRNTSDRAATVGKSSSVYHIADHPEGPWVAVPLSISCNNPAPLILSNGTAFLVCKNNGFYLYRADRLGADFKLMFKLPPFTPGSGHWEDPFLYLDHRDNWHIIAHSWNHTDDFDISGHYFSPDGLSWTPSPTQPFGHTAQLTDGTQLKMRTRERPKLLFDSAGHPTHLFNGINTNPYCPSPAVECKVKAGYDWDYTFVQPLVQQ